MKRVALISVNMEKRPYAVFPLGISYIRAALEEVGYECVILDFSHLEFSQAQLHAKLTAFDPAVIGISIRNLDNCCMARPRSFVPYVKQCVQWLREWNPYVPVILGGSAFSLLPSPWMEATGADYGIVGDGSQSMVLLTDAILMDNAVDTPHTVIPRIIYSHTSIPLGSSRAGQPKDKWQLIPRRDGFMHELNPSVVTRHNLQSKTGCGFKCIYCAYPALEGSQVRMRQPSEVIEEIKQLMERDNIKQFDFVDNVFNFPVHHAEEICRTIIDARLDISWGCFLSPAFITPELVRLLRDAGCTHAELGIDSGSEACLETLKKGFDTQAIRNTVAVCRENRLPFSICLLFGTPGETIDHVKETFSLMEELDIQEGFGLAGIRVLPHTRTHEAHCPHLEPEQLLEPRFYLSQHLDIKKLYREFEEFRKKYPRWILL
jgi:radical SAM superfamily enzyme YgiQ (UPF0313 family)